MARTKTPIDLIDSGSATSGHLAQADGAGGTSFGPFSATSHDHERFIVFTFTDPTADLTTGDNKAFVHIPAPMAGMNLTAVHAVVSTAPVTSGVTIQIHNVTSAADMLSTELTIDATETGSETAATPAVIDTAEDDVALNDVIRLDIDAVGGTAAKGLCVTLTFEMP